MNFDLMESRLAERPTSPLFARLASHYLEQGEPGRGKTLCQTGLEHFPGYASAHVVLARCLAAEGDYRSALQELQHALECASDGGLLHRLQLDWEARRVGPEQGVGQDVMDREVVELEPPPVEAPAASEPPLVGSTEQDAPGHGEPEPPAMEAAPPPEPEAVRLPEVRPEQEAQPAPEMPPEDDRIASRTLAEIYARQGEFLEAIITYQLLKRQRPELAGEFDGRIQELEIKLQEKLAE